MEFLYFYLLKTFTICIATNCGKFLELEVAEYLTGLMRNLYVGQEATVKARHGTTDWFQIGKGVWQAVCCHPAYLTYMQSTSCKMLG